MTKDWDLFQDEIKELSFSQKKTLEEVKELMAKKHRFRASTRAYRMKLKEWGLMRHRPRGSAGDRRERGKRSKSLMIVDENGREEESAGMVEAADMNDSPKDRVEETEEWQIDAALPSLGTDEISDVMESSMTGHEDLQTSPQMWIPEPTQPPDIVSDMVEAVLDSDLERLQRLISRHVDRINEPIGSLLLEPGGALFGHPALSQMVILQHPEQTLLDIACGMPCGPIIWFLLAYGAKGSKHPLGSDLALHNAIKNGRVHTVQALLQPGRSDINGLSDSKWTPLRQAVFWMHPEIVRILLHRGAHVEDMEPPLPPIAQPSINSPLQLCLARRIDNYADSSYRVRCHDILDDLLDQGANVHSRAEDPTIQSALDAFLQPWRTRPYWAFHITQQELKCFAMIVSRGSDLRLPFPGVPCQSPSRDTFLHQALWHSTPTLARSIIDSFSPSHMGNGRAILYEILGSCPDAKRHATDTLRDLQVTLAKGVSPNRTQNDTISPLRKCIIDCPAVDLIARLQVLLDRGADPAAPDPDGVQPYVLAVETFDEPLLSEVMLALVSKMSGAHFQAHDSASYQGPREFFPISSTQTYEHVCASNLGGDLALFLQDRVPEHVRPAVHKAYFTIVSKLFVETMARRAKDRLLDDKERGEVFHVTSMLECTGLSAMRFDSDFVTALLHTRPSPSSTTLEPASQPNTADGNSPVSIDESSPASSVTVAPPPSTRAPFQFNPNSSATISVAPRPSPSQPSPSMAADEFFIPSTTQLRWLDPCAKPHPKDLQKALDAVIDSTCEICNDRKMLTKREVERHKVEHAHSTDCAQAHCMRRFCVARRESRGADDLRDQV
ncbi:hypothetical protein yc1106_05180 [Curvularia clavata]|uniref:Clr5 domain-containing protein n=1 Tax=Curvularia clavata TaxID=95742 RepID=A0A9Q8Z7N1_CURCL|nr:hypothetical protein yc1106_05180 [Curvularia clavata]